MIIGIWQPSRQMLKMSIANDIIVFFSIIILITSCCPNTVKNRIDLRIPEDEKLWIPNINSPITYINQDGELAIFDKVTTEIEYRETDLCGPESCCDEIYSLETKRLTLAKVMKILIIKYTLKSI